MGSACALQPETSGKVDSEYGEKGKKNKPLPVKAGAVCLTIKALVLLLLHQQQLNLRWVLGKYLLGSCNGKPQATKLPNLHLAKNEGLCCGG